MNIYHSQQCPLAVPPIAHLYHSQQKALGTAQAMDLVPSSCHNRMALTFNHLAQLFRQDQAGNLKLISYILYVLYIS